MTRTEALTRALSSVIAMFGASVSAQQPSFGPLSYDYLLASYVINDLDSGGLELGASFEVAERVHAFASYQDWELNERVDRSILQIGAGYRWDLSANLDLVARVALADSDLDGPGPFSVDDEGLILSGMLRTWIAPNVELAGELMLDDSLGSDLETVLEFGGQYHLNERFSVGGRIRVDDDETTLFLGGRFYFRVASRR